MKLSVSVPDETVAMLDRVVKLQGFASRSAAIQQGIELLVNESLLADYRAAFRASDEPGDAAVCQAATGDGIEVETKWW
jgi:Arc/MetJ-type ribon-helix-helix transcriptional regulator